VTRIVPEPALVLSVAAPRDDAVAATALPFRVSGVEKRFGSDPPVLHGVDLDVPAGQMVARSVRTAAASRRSCVAPCA
jgi:hypothetical protein